MGRLHSTYDDHAKRAVQRGAAIDWVDHIPQSRDASAGTARHAQRPAATANSSFRRILVK
jgi:hypothetical protein